MSFVRAYVGLGSNLGNPIQQVRTALAELAQLPATRVAEYSGFYRSAPVGPVDQPDYINAVAALDTGIPPDALLDALQSIEQAHGRERTVRWGPRTLDLDLLLYGNEILSSERLTVPHPEMTRRRFVLVPLAELVPELVLPGGQSLRKIVQACGDAEVLRLDE